ncbi:FAD-binding protein [Rhodococcus rhodnii]|uniref:FAD-binding protein n=2 Tax=Rhodococcus rhodnii TaxID=38312 RepID=A0A6P2CI24_9NOCA|nr:FAD-binding protein [Rhodococcus rhodnii]
MLAYRHDQSMLTAAGTPAAVVRASSVDDVVATLEFAYEHAIPVVPRGAGTGLAGGANALDGAIVLSLERMNRIVSIDVAARTATVEPGVINADLAAAAAEHGLWYVPDPGSRAISTIGGNLATNAGGMCCAKYGVTLDHVATIDAVLADGRRIHVGSETRKNVAGLNLAQLLVGSEGTLAVVVGATMRLRSAPGTASTVVAAFGTTAEAIDAVGTIVARTTPRAVEFLDRTTVRAVEEMTRMGLDTEAAGLLLVQCDGRDASGEAADVVAACASAREVYATDDPEEGEQFMAARYAALPALERLGSTLLDDLAVPVPALPAMLREIEAIALRTGVTIGCFGHAADGNLHPTVVFDAADDEQTARARAAFDAMVDACLALGGTITGEHGVGVLKRPYLCRQVGETERELMAGIKRVFDPRGILNPGRGF